MSDYMNVAGTEAAVTQARQDYEIALNREKARQAQVGAFGSRGTVEEAGLIESYLTIKSQHYPDISSLASVADSPFISARKDNG